MLRPKGGPDLAARAFHVARVDRSVEPARRADGEEDHVRLGDVGDFVRHPQPSRKDGGLQEPLQTRLMDRCPAHLDEGEPLQVDIDTERVEPPIGEGDGGTESDVTQADERYGHLALAHGTISTRASGGPSMTLTVPLMRFCGR